MMTAVTTHIVAWGIQRKSPDGKVEYLVCQFSITGAEDQAIACVEFANAYPKTNYFKDGWTLVGDPAVMFVSPELKHQWEILEETTAAMLTETSTPHLKLVTTNSVTD